MVEYGSSTLEQNNNLSVSILSCSDHRQVALPTINTVITVPAPVTPSVQISGALEKQSHRPDEFVPGIYLFPNVDIMVGTEKELDEQAMDKKVWFS